MRLEIKIPYSNFEKIFVEKWLISYKKLVNQHPQRKVNSIYYDNMNLDLATQNIQGLSKRCKFRLRYYCSDLTSNCNIEIKKKTNRFGSKKIINTNKKLSEINLYDIFSINSNWKDKLMKDEYAQKYIINDKLYPQIQVGYFRNYYIYDDIRITDDQFIEFKSIDLNTSNTRKLIHDDFNVLEVKFNMDNLDKASQLIGEIPLKPKRYSKYLRGLSLFNSATYF